MPRRQIPLVTGEIYHVFNRSVARQPILTTQRNCQRILDLINFYRFPNTNVRYSHFARLSTELKQQFLDDLTKQNQQVEIVCFTLMPNHYHFLIRQKSENGISNFIRHLQNGYAKYFNLKNERSGAVFQAMFKAVRIENEEQFIHIARYIHLNPLTSYVLNNIEQLNSYPWNSYMDYLQENTHSFIDPTFLTNLFGSKTKLQEFTENQIDYQRSLAQIFHLTLEDHSYPSVSTQSTPGVG